MIIYHGSTCIVERPEIRVGSKYLDFGIGFYTTSSYEQAERWTRIKMRREGLDFGYVSEYEFDYNAARQTTVIRRFDTADLEWLLFVVRNRRGERPNQQADMYIGPVANDNVYQSIRLFETGVIDANDTVRRLRTEKLHDQWTFHTDRILQYLRFRGYKEIR